MSYRTSLYLQMVEKCRPHTPTRFPVKNGEGMSVHAPTVFLSGHIHPVFNFTRSHVPKSYFRFPSPDQSFLYPTGVKLVKLLKILQKYWELPNPVRLAISVMLRLKFHSNSFALLTRNVLMYWELFIPISSWNRFLIYRELIP